MKKYLVPFVLLVVTIFLSYSYSLVSFFLIFLLLLSMAVILLFGVVWVFKKNLNRNWFRVPFIIVVICLAGILAAIMAPLNAALVSSEDVRESLAYAYQTDQNDRKNLKFYLSVYGEEMKRRDSLRLQYALQLHRKNEIEKPMSKFHAAFIIHHNYKRDSSLYEIAHKLASDAASANELSDVYEVQWLSKATYDRWMLSLGKPQKYDTQGKVGISIE